MKKLRQQRSGFSLIELLIVVGIIALLLSIITSGGAKIRQLAERQQGASNARQIVLAYITYSRSFAPARHWVADTSGSYKWAQGKFVAGNAQQFAACLADLADFGSIDVWFSGADKIPSKDDVPSILTDDATPVIDPQFLTALVSWDIAVVHSSALANLSDSDILFLFTDGLTEVTTATSPYSAFGSNSPWGTSGGHFAFLDAHVEWRPNLADGLPCMKAAGTGNTTVKLGSFQKKIGDVLGGEPGNKISKSSAFGNNYVRSNDTTSR